MARGTATPALHIGFTAFNSEQTVQDALTSLLSQDFEDWRMTVIDAGSADRTVEIASSLARRDPRVTVVENRARTSWFQNAKDHLIRSDSEFFMLADADDRWTSNWISANLEILRESALDASFGRIGVIAQDGTPANHVAVGNTITGLDSKFRLLRQARFAVMPESRGKANIIYSIWRSDALRRVMPWHLESLHGSRDLQFLVTALDSLLIGSTGRATMFRRQGRRPDSRLAIEPLSSPGWRRGVVSLGSKVPPQLPREYALATEGAAARCLVGGIVAGRVTLSHAIQFVAHSGRRR